MAELDHELITKIYKTQKVTAVSETKFTQLMEDKFNQLCGLCDTCTSAILVLNDLGENTEIPASFCYNSFSKTADSF
jgi:hypothetical protein